jgi:hypothetical protein
MPELVERAETNGVFSQISQRVVKHGTTPITLKPSSNPYTAIISVLGKTDISILGATKGKTMLIPFSVSEGAALNETGWLTSIYNTCKGRDVSIMSCTKKVHKSRNPTSGQFIFTMHLPFGPQNGKSQSTKNPKSTTGWLLTAVRPPDILLLFKLKSTLNSKNLMYK